MGFSSENPTYVQLHLPVLGRLKPKLKSINSVSSSELNSSVMKRPTVPQHRTAGFLSCNFMRNSNNEALNVNLGSATSASQPERKTSNVIIPTIFLLNSKWSWRATLYKLRRTNYENQIIWDKFMWRITRNPFSARAK